ncbi:type II toxin-antitoxin system VapB family antitoxin [Brevundimonas sp.]|uniref:type II toxin-antitoxin system VapB family antitoxin n=1 Tax=Brevundimonas sp. TaxID=1871086 RepID=UPI002ABBC595|nr:type II toxin-antitoxin system VapB family antitoxin [Brevundimonas sp.]MDZ4362974.1 type II toxin-antitoxin system VapB family antitoxin [Brevundimonas sp.]
MAFHVRDAETDAMVRTLARQRGVGLTEAVRLAVQSTLAQRDAEADERLKAMREVSDRVSRRPGTGLKADKAFFDEMSGD